MGIEQSQFNSSFFEKNPSFTATHHVIELTRPLSSLGLGYFTFDRHYIDGGRIVLTNHAQWIKNYWQSGLFKSAIFEKTPRHFLNGHVFWDWLNREPVYSEAALHGIDHGVTLTKNHEQHCDFFHFGSLNNGSINNDLIIHNIEYLHRFASIFEHKMMPLIREAERDRIFAYSYNNKQAAAEASNQNRNVFEDNLLDLLGKRDASRFYLGEEFDYCYLTRGEIIFLEELVAGASCSDISKKLNASDDAVNKHIKSIKAKLGCKTLCHIGFVTGRLGANTIHPFSIKKKEY